MGGTTEDTEGTEKRSGDLTTDGADEHGWERVVSLSRDFAILRGL